MRHVLSVTLLLLTQLLERALSVLRHLLPLLRGLSLNPVLSLSSLNILLLIRLRRINTLLLHLALLIQR